MSEGINIPRQESEVILEEMEKIEKLDASIRELELQRKKGNEELCREQSRNRERLRDMLLSGPSESEFLSSSTRKFLDLHENKIEADPEDDCEEHIDMTDEEKKRIEDLLNRQDSPHNPESSPYFINEDMQNILNKHYKDESIE